MVQSRATTQFITFPRTVNQPHCMMKPIPLLSLSRQNSLLSPVQQPFKQIPASQSAYRSHRVSLRTVYYIYILCSYYYVDFLYFQELICSALISYDISSRADVISLALLWLLSGVQDKLELMLMTKLYCIDVQIRVPIKTSQDVSIDRYDAIVES